MVSDKNVPAVSEVPIVVGWRYPSINVMRGAIGKDGQRAQQPLISRTPLSYGFKFKVGQYPCHDKTHGKAIDHAGQLAAEKERSICPVRIAPQGPVARRAPNYCDRYT